MERWSKGRNVQKTLGSPEQLDPQTCDLHAQAGIAVKQARSAIAFQALALVAASMFAGGYLPRCDSGGKDQQVESSADDVYIEKTIEHLVSVILDIFTEEDFSAVGTTRSEVESFLKRKLKSVPLGSLEEDADGDLGRNDALKQYIIAVNAFFDTEEKLSGERMDDKSEQIRGARMIYRLARMIALNMDFAMPATLEAQFIVHNPHFIKYVPLPMRNRGRDAGFEEK